MEASHSQVPSQLSTAVLGLRLMARTLLKAKVWMPPNPHTNVLLRCRPPFIVLTGKDMEMWRMDAAGGAAEKTISLAGYGPNVVAVNWNTQYLVIAERTQPDGCGSAIRLMPMKSRTMTAASIVVQSPFPIEPSYFDLFQTVDRFVILASMGSRLGKVCSNCPMYSTFCVEVPFDSSAKPRANRIGHIDSCSGNDTEPPDQRFTTTLFKPQGLLYGDRGPFLACSNGVDVLWYSFNQAHDSNVKQSAKLLSLPMLTQSASADGTPVDQWSSSGCRKVFFAGSKLVALWTDFHAKQRSVWVLEPEFTNHTYS